VGRKTRAQDYQRGIDRSGVPPVFRKWGRSGRFRAKPLQKL